VSWWRGAGLELRRQWWRNRAAPGPLHDYLARPFPAPGSDWRDIEYLVLDFETTGIDPREHEILSAGYLVVRDATVHVGSAVHRLIRPEGMLPARSVVVHGITDDLSAQGQPSTEVIGELLAALAGRVLVGHHAATEFHFLSRACRQLFGAPFVGPVIDTLALEARTMRRDGQQPQRGDLRLGGARTRRGLPRYRAHNALIDALATAELFLAQASEFGDLRLATLLAPL